MEKIVRKILINTLGFEQYLELVSRIYLAMVHRGMLKNKYPELFFLRHLLKPGDVCVDIGANVGYYSTFMSKLVGPSGKVIAVEPVKLFADLFKHNAKRWALNNITLEQTALGANEGTVTMGTPRIDGVLRHGLTHIVAENEDCSNMHTYQVPITTPDQLFANVAKIDFVKCDVEGYEVLLFPLFTKVLTKHKPVLQIEISGVANVEKMLAILQPLGYEAYGLSDHKLNKLLAEQALKHTSDFYFLPQ
jgi:FkbM family methyltransferase